MLAVEPSPSLVAQLRFNVQSNGIHNIDIAPVAVGDETGTATLHVVSRQRGRSSLYDVSGSDLRLTVPVEPLLSVLTKHGIARIDAIKIDIEGYEDRALLPFFATAPREMWPRRLLIETLARGTTWRQDCIAHLAGLGYTTEWHGKRDALLVLCGLQATPGANS